SLWIMSTSGRSSSALTGVTALEGKEINLVCFTGDYHSPLAQAADTAFIIHDPQQFDVDIYWRIPLFGSCIVGVARL
ncbi:MurR/RpiR family transcriptional regulator, partial [Klebsiella pneumoniae]|nr:MurR/RpiR family transcriptional regulator [Klebsiella pneumoniae]